MKCIGKYKIRGLLGRGGMGKVLQVEVPVIKRILALKLLAPADLLLAMVGRDQLVRLFTHEAKSMAAIHHPNIIEVLDFGTFQDSPYYVMDYYGNSLGAVMGETYITEAPSRILRIEKVVHYTRQILEGLRRLHAAGIVHRDIKPFNILLTEDDNVKICDFGLSKLRGERMAVPASLKVGSPYYAAPEQEDAPDQVDHSADLYAVGVMVYRMLTGTLPQHLIEPASGRNANLTPDWDTFLTRALHPQPSRRYRDALSMSDDLMSLFRRWQSQVDATCQLYTPDRAMPPSNGPEAPRAPRSEPLRTGVRKARELFGLNALWQPHNYNPHPLKADPNNATVLDPATGLQWLQGGSDFPMDWWAALAYIDALNDCQWGGHSDWRLPTVEELLTILRPPPADTDYCLPSTFATDQKRLWSSDRRAYTSAWYVSLELGFVAWQDKTFANHVKAVRHL